MLPESKNIQTIADNIRSLENQINALDVEIPPHASADAGKILAVDSKGDLEWKKEYSYTPPAYSSTEEVNTGQKWIDGKDIYMKMLSGTFPEITTATNMPIGIIEGAESIVNTYSLIKSGSTSIINRYYIVFYSNTYGFQMGNVSTAYSECDYIAIIYYTKVNETETKSKKGGNKK